MRNVRGLTLVELLVSVALMGLTAVFMASLFQHYAVRQKSEMDLNALSEDSLNFVENTEAMLMAATQIRHAWCGRSIWSDDAPLAPLDSCPGTNQVCNCVTGGNTTPCNDSATPQPIAPGTASTILEWIYEDSQDPGQVGVGSCAHGSWGEASSNANPTNYVGCKKVARLRLVQPVDSTPGPSRPGRLELEVADIQGATLGPWNSVAALPNNNHAASALQLGVIDFRCGFRGTALGGGIRSDLFRLNITVKANTPSDLDPHWAPQDPKVMEGTVRQVSLDIPLVNISMRGVMYGKRSSVRNCVPDALSASDASRCCGGYRQPGGRCHSCFQNTVLQACDGPLGGSHATASDIADFCASHMVSANGNLCL